MQYRFGAYTLDLLVYLLTPRGRGVSRQELLDTRWPESSAVACSIAAWPRRAGHG
ncbi:MAG: hypothetical protein O7G88_02830 [bacterium]|nr:hypothetical protein [bacterium]